MGETIRKENNGCEVSGIEEDQKAVLWQFHVVVTQYKSVLGLKFRLIYPTDPRNYFSLVNFALKSCKNTFDSAKTSPRYPKNHLGSYCVLSRRMMIIPRLF